MGLKREALRPGAIASRGGFGARLGPSRWGLLVVAIVGAMVVAMLTGRVSPSKRAVIAAAASADSVPEAGSVSVFASLPGVSGDSEGTAFRATPSGPRAMQRMQARTPDGRARAAAAAETRSQTSPFFPCTLECIVVDTEAPIEGTSAVLRRHADRLSATITSRELVAGHVHTIWFVIFNTPEFCTANPSGPMRCGAQDVFNPLTKTSHMWGGSSTARADGTLSARASVEVSDRAVFPWEPGLIDPSKAEVVIALRSHGAPNGAADQTTTMNGGCIQAAMLPGTGSIGPNSCENKQAAAFPA